MRLARSMFSSSQVRLYRQFRRHIANPYQVDIETSNIGHKSVWRGRSFSAAVPSDACEGKKSRKKVSKGERKAMVEAIVNKYKAVNGGKFPPASKVQEEAGGSYYVIRQMLQEMQYNSKMSSIGAERSTSAGNQSTKKKEMSNEELSSDPITSVDAQKMSEILVGKELINNEESSTNPAQVSGTVSVTADICEDDCMTSQDDQKTIEILVGEEFNSNNESSTNAAQVSGTVSVTPDISEDGSITSQDAQNTSEILVGEELIIKNESSTSAAQVSGNVSVTADIGEDGSNNVATKAHQGVEDKQSLHSQHEKPVDNVKQEMPSRESYKEPSEDAEPQGKSSIWENLKSFANGFFGIWRKH